MYAADIKMAAGACCPGGYGQLNKAAGDSPPSDIANEGNSCQKTMRYRKRSTVRVRTEAIMIVPKTNLLAMESLLTGTEGCSVYTFSSALTLYHNEALSIYIAYSGAQHNMYV